MEFITQDPQNIQFVDPDSAYYRDLCGLALELDATIFPLFHEPSDDLQLEAVIRCPANIAHLNNPSSDFLYRIIKLSPPCINDILAHWASDRDVFLQGVLTKMAYVIDYLDPMYQTATVIDHYFQNPEARDFKWFEKCPIKTENYCLAAMRHTTVPLELWVDDMSVEMKLAFLRHNWAALKLTAHVAVSEMLELFQHFFHKQFVDYECALIHAVMQKPSIIAFIPTCHLTRTLLAKILCLSPSYAKYLTPDSYDLAIDLEPLAIGFIKSTPELCRIAVAKNVNAIWSIYENKKMATLVETHCPDLVQIYREQPFPEFIQRAYSGQVHYFIPNGYRAIVKAIQTNDPKMKRLAQVFLDCAEPRLAKCHICYEKKAPTILDIQCCKYKVCTPCLLKSCKPICPYCRQDIEC